MASHQELINLHTLLNQQTKHKTRQGVLLDKQIPKQWVKTINTEKNPTATDIFETFPSIPPGFSDRLEKREETFILSITEISRV